MMRHQRRSRRELRDRVRLSAACMVAIVLFTATAIVVNREHVRKDRKKLGFTALSPPIPANTIELALFAVGGGLFVLAACYLASGLSGLDRVEQLRGHCWHCGYDLTGNVSGRCPECGKPCKSDADSATWRGPP
jgi:hypothetical protein